MARFRNIHKRGTGAYDAFLAAELRQRARLAQANVKRAKRPQAIRKTERRAAAIERQLAKVTARQRERARLGEDERQAFNRMGIRKQNYFLTSDVEYRDPAVRLLVEYPHDPPPRSVPDPFATFGERRNPTWTLYYRSLTRKKRRPRRMRRAA
jgi:hypothetical protein